MNLNGHFTIRQFCRSKTCLYFPGLTLMFALLVLISCSNVNSIQTDTTTTGLTGNAISYSGFRLGQSPDTRVYPSRAEILEDLRILGRNWQLIRLYGADEFSIRVLEVIEQENINIKVMLGAWLGREPHAIAENQVQIEEAIRLANAYKDIVVAINVGNEILVDWSFHSVPEEQVIKYVQLVQTAVSVPVTVADNYAYWRDHGEKLIQVVDFVTIHTYPIWEKRNIDQGLSYTIENVEQVRAVLPAGKQLVIGEAGWATYTIGDQHVKQAGDEVKQERYYRELTEWCRQESIPLFWFEAFDEPWKGTGTEGYWGLFTEDRKAKPVMHDLYPDLIGATPTSPAYKDTDFADLGIDLSLITVSAYRETFGPAKAILFAPNQESVSISAVSRPGVSDEYLLFEHHGADWGGFYFILNQSVDISNFKTLIFDINISDAVSKLEFKIEGPREKAASVDLQQFQHGATAEGWQEIRIPLAEFATVDLTQLSVLGFWNPQDSTGTFMDCSLKIDNLRLAAD